MRVLLVNAFHYLKGGVERTYLDESRWLAAAGHEVAHLAIRDPRNLPSPTAEHFAPAVDFGEGAPLGRQLAALPRAMWSAPAEAAARAVIAAFRPEIAHVHAPSRYLTPSVLHALGRAGVPTVMTLHDFKPWCTNRILFARGAACERCRGGRHWNALLTGCVQGSRAKSAIGTVEAYLHDLRAAYRPVRLWIAPSRFVVDKAREFGVAADRLRLLPHGVETEAAPAASALAPDEPFVFFAGRHSEEKGVRQLPALARRIAPRPLLALGEGPLTPWLKREAAGLPNLCLLGHRSDAEVAALRARAAVVVVPSLFYEHFCYAAAEALLDARPVVASSIGAIPELVEHEVTGLLVPPGDAAALGAAVERALTDPGASAWGARGRERVSVEGQPRLHVERLEAIYREALASR
jgi:glycosyltransferase involved in cell wall biosynthesis